MGYRNRKGILRSLLISIRDAVVAVIEGFRALDPDYARKVRDEMNHRE